jgi:hypothetical protein
MFRARAVEPRILADSGHEPATEPDVVEPSERDEHSDWHRASARPLSTKPLPVSTSSLVFVDQATQEWMADVLASVGYSVDQPVMVTEAWHPARTPYSSGQQYLTRAVPPKVKAFSRNGDPSTSHAAGLAAAARQAISATSEMGLLLLAYSAHEDAAPGVGFTAEEVGIAANLLGDGNGPWRRVSDLVDALLLAVLLDATGQPVVRKNTTARDARVMVLTPLGRSAAARLKALQSAGHLEAVLNFDTTFADALFGNEVAALATVPPPLPAMMHTTKTPAATEPVKGPPADAITDDHPHAR